MKNKRSKRYPAETIRDADYAEDPELLASSPRLNLYCIAWSNKQETLASMWMQIKQSSDVLTQKEPSSF